MVEYTDLLKQARLDADMTQLEAATRTGLTSQHWGQIERGATHGSDETRARMALVVNLRPNQLEDIGCDLVADQMRRMLAGADGELPAASLDGAGDELDDVIILRSILVKLSPAELVWLVNHLDLLTSLGGQRNSGDRAQHTA